MPGKSQSVAVSFTDTDRGFKIKAAYKIKTINLVDYNLTGTYEKEWKAQDIYPTLSDHGKKYYVKKLKADLQASFTKHFMSVAGRFIINAQQKTDIRDKKPRRVVITDFKSFETDLKAHADKLVEGVKDKVMKGVQADGTRDMKKVKSGAKDVALGTTGAAVGGVATAHGGGAMSSMATVSSAVTALNGVRQIWTSRVKHEKNATSKLAAGNASLKEASTSFGELELAHQKLKAQLESADKKLAQAQTALQQPAKTSRKAKALRDEKSKLQKAIKTKCITDLDNFKNLMANLERAMAEMKSLTSKLKTAENSLTSNAQDVLALAQNIQTLVRK